MCCAGASKRPRASSPIRAGAAARSARSPSPGASTAHRISAAVCGSASECPHASTARGKMGAMDTRNPILWQPSAERLSHCALTRFAQFARERHGAPVMQADPAADWQRLHRWSVEQRAAFWSALWDFAGIIGERGAATLDDGERMPGARWFADARINFAENLLAGFDAVPALIARDECGRRRELSRRELRQQVAAVAAGFAAAGVRAGDVVAGFVANGVEAVVAMLATAHLGAVWTSVSPEFGAPAAVERFGQTGARLLVATTGYQYAGREHDCTEKVRQLADSLPDLQALVLIGSLPPVFEQDERALAWQQLLQSDPAAAGAPRRLPFD